MSQRPRLSQLLRSLAIQGGNHWITMAYEGEQWQFPVSEGRVGPLQGGGRAEEDLPTLAALGVALEINAHPGKTPPPDARWPLAARLARVLDDVERPKSQASPQAEGWRQISVVEQMDGLQGFAEALEFITTEEQLVDKAIEYLTDIRPRPALLSRIDAGNWLGPQGRIDGRVDVIDEAAEKGLLTLRRAIGESYERQLSDTDFDRVAILPLAEDLVVLVPCHGPDLEERPRDLRVLLSLYRSASRWLSQP